MAHRLYLIENKITHQIESIYPHHALLTVAAYDMQPSLPPHLPRPAVPDLISDYLTTHTLVPVKNIRLAMLDNRHGTYSITYTSDPINRKHQFRILTHFSDKADQHNYQQQQDNDLGYNNLFFESLTQYDFKPSHSCILIRNNDECNHTYRHQKHTTSHTSRFNRRHIRCNNLIYNQKYNSVKTSKLRHCNRKQSDLWYDYDLRQSRRSTGWKSRKIKHQWMIHLSDQKSVDME